MSRLMYDAVDAGSIPVNATMVAGYVDGPESQWSEEDWSLFPNATKVRIAVSASTNDGHVLDVEYKDATALESVDWTIMRRASGLATPTVYCGDGVAGYTRAEVLAAHDARGVERPQIWLASWTYSPPVIPPGCIAVQYASGIMLGTNYDLSLAADYWPGVDPDPNPQPDPTPGGVTQQDIQNTLDRIETAFQQVQELAANLQGMKENLSG